MKIIAISKPAKQMNAEKLEQPIKQEAQQLWDLYLLGVVREFYSTADKPGAVLILECADVTEAKRHLDDLIFVSEVLIEFAYYPLAPFKPLGSLFAK